MKTIGLLGGMSWESTAEYYRLLNELTRERLGGLHSTPCVLYSVDFARIEQLQASGNWDEAGRLLAEAAVAVQAAGADMLLLCTNTMHKVADQVAAAVRIPFVHLADTTADAVRAKGLRRIGLLGTAFTMEEDFYRGRLAAHGLDVFVPGAEGRRAVIADLVAAGAEGVVLGCTEIELLIGPDDSPVPVFPTTLLHVEAAVTLALASPEPVGGEIGRAR